MEETPPEFDLRYLPPPRSSAAKARHLEAMAQELSRVRAELVCAQIVMDALQDQWKRHTLSSSFEGVVIAVHKKVGETVKSGEVSFTVRKQPAKQARP